MIRIVLLAAALAACSPPPVPPPPEPPAAPAAIALEGQFSATSTTAMGITGDLTVSANRLSFGKGFMLDTAPAAPIEVTSPVLKGGESFASTMTLPTSLTIELRSITTLTRAADAGPQPLCGPEAPTFVALAHDTPATAVSMAVFSGPDAPGPEAVNSTLCGTFTYDR